MKPSSFQYALFTAAFLGVFLDDSSASEFAASGAAHAFEEKIKSLPFPERASLGPPISAKDFRLYDGQLIIRAHARGFIAAYIANRDIRIQKFVFQPNVPKANPLGDIAGAYDVQGGRKTFGEPLIGEHSLFDDKFRFHVFRNAVIVWRQQDRAVQSAILQQKFLQ